MKRRAKKKEQPNPPTIRFRFKADRFGHIPNSEPLKIEYARAADRAVTSWLATVEKLFGDSFAAFDTAVKARILPPYPSWSTTKKALDAVHSWLEALPAGGEPGKEPIVDRATQDAVEQLRIYLGILSAWARIFRAGIWVAGVGARGSTEAEPAARLLQGLKTLASVYEFDATFTPERVQDEFKKLLPPKDPTPPPKSVPPSPNADEAPPQHALIQLAALLEPDFTANPFSPSKLEAAGNKAIVASPSVADFAADPNQLSAWLEDVLADVENYHYRDPLPAPSVWNRIEDNYWAQWSWPSMGAVARLGRTPVVSAFDLVYTTRFSCLPLVHWRGGNLSIAQWSRLLEVARHRTGKALDAPERAGYGNLGFTEETAPEGTGARSPKPPIAMISLHSETSPAWAWLPEPNIRAFALMPPHRAEQDERSARYGEDRESADAASEGMRLAERAIATARRDQFSAALLQCIEVVDRKPPERTLEDQLLPWTAWHRVYFGSEAPDSLDYAPYVSSPSDLGEIVAEMEDRNRLWFPRAEKDLDGPIARIRHELASVGELLRLVYRDSLAAVVWAWRRTRNWRKIVAAKIGPR